MQGWVTAAPSDMTSTVPHMETGFIAFNVILKELRRPDDTLTVPA